MEEFKQSRIPEVIVCPQLCPNSCSEISLHVFYCLALERLGIIPICLAWLAEAQLSVWKYHFSGSEKFRVWQPEKRQATKPPCSWNRSPVGCVWSVVNHFSGVRGKQARIFKYSSHRSTFRSCVPIPLHPRGRRNHTRRVFVVFLQYKFYIKQKY